MKNKKALVLIPAFSVLTLTTLASVSGAVAWFTASRQVEAHVTEMTITRLNGNLTITAEAVANTTVEKVNNTKYNIKITDNTYLTHASFDGANNVVYAPNLDFNPNGDGKGRYAIQESTYTAGKTTEGKNVVYAIQWKLKFDYAFGGDTSTVDLFLDTNPANVKVTDAGTQSGTLETHTGIRFNFKEDKGTDLTWAPYAASTGVKCVNSVDDPEEGTAYTSTRKVVGSDTSVTKYFTDDDAKTTGAGYLGQFTGADSPVTSHTYTVTAWFEGTDAGVVDGAKLQNVLANLKFYTRKDTTK